MSLSKGDIAKAAGYLQEKIDRVNTNYTNALETAAARIAKKYRTILQERLLPVDKAVVAVIELPEYYYETDVDVETLAEGSKELTAVPDARDAEDGMTDEERAEVTIGV